MKLTAEEFSDLVRELGILIPQPDIERLYVGLMSVERNAPKNPVHHFISAYCEAFKDRYGTSPMVSGTTAGIAKRLVTDFGVDKMVDMVGAYLGSNDPYFLTKHHDLATFSANLNKVQVILEKGRSLTRTEINDLERRDANANAFGRLLGRTDPGAKR